MLHLKKHLILRLQAKGIFDNCHQALVEDGWEVFDEFADSFVDFFENKISNE